MASKYVIAGVAGILISGLAALGVWKYGDSQYEAGQQAERDHQSKLAAKENEQNRKVKDHVDTTKDTAFDRYIEERDRAVAAADAARDELGRLRNVLQRYQRGAAQGGTAKCGTDEAAALAGSVETLAGRHQESSRDAELDAQQVIGLQDYIESIAPLCIEKGRTE